MFWTLGPAVAAAIASEAQAKASRDAMRAYREIGTESLKLLAGTKCEYCRGLHAKSYCPNCGAPTPIQQQRNEGN